MMFEFISDISRKSKDFWMLTIPILLLFELEYDIFSHSWDQWQFFKISETKNTRKVDMMFDYN